MLTGKPEKLPELIVEAPMRNATITKNRVQRPRRTHNRATRPSQMPETTSDLTDAPPLTILEEASPNETPPTSPTKSPVPLSPIKSPSIKSPPLKSPSPNVSTPTESLTVSSE